MMAIYNDRPRFGRFSITQLSAFSGVFSNKQPTEGGMGKTKNGRRRHLKVVHRDSAGIDIGFKELLVAVPADSVPKSVRVFGTLTDDLHTLRDWPTGCWS